MAANQIDVDGQSIKRGEAMVNRELSVEWGGEP